MRSVRVDVQKCTGSGNCALVSPEVFELDEMTNKARVLLETPPEELTRWVEQAARQCPTNAIVVSEQ